MSNVPKLKKQAAELELKKQFDKALAIYIKLLDSFDENASELDVALFNRVGDLLLRQGNVADAVDYYEQAVDRYGETGFFNNAIALCNKILRHSPGRASVYYKLGKISAQKGFKNDAKVNFLEYADRMQKAGKVDEAFRALKEFADLCPDQDEIRLMLAEQLTKADRKTEAVEQLQTLHERYDSEGRVSEAAATAVRMRAIDPSVEPRSAGGGRRASTSGDLVFLDLDTPSPGASGSYTRQRTPPAPARVRRPTPPLPAPEPAVDIPLINTDFVIGTPLSVPVVDDPLADIMIADESLGVVKSTPTSSLFSIDEPVDEPIVEELVVEEEVADEPLSFGTPLSSATIDETFAVPTPLSSDVVDKAPPPQFVTPQASYTPAASFIEVSAEDFDGPNTEPVSHSSTPTHGMVDQPVDAESDLDGPLDLDLEFVIPTAESTPPSASDSIDFDLSSLTTPPIPSTPSARSATPIRPTPNTTRVALDGLPLMDLEVPGPTPRSTPRLPMPREGLPMTGDLELIDDPNLGVMPELVNDPFLGAESTGENEDSFIDLNAESLTLDDDYSEVIPTPSVSRRSTLVAAHSVEVLRSSVEDEPDNWALHRELAEAMLEAGDRDGGISELELAMNGAERAGDLDLASSLAEEIARLEPEIVRHHQKRVEYAFRTNDRARLIEAYVSLADSLLASDQTDKARTVYQRVLDLAPDDVRARTAIDTIAEPELEPLPPPSTSRAAGPGRTSGPTSINSNGATTTGETFVNLGDWLRDDAVPRDTRMVVDEQEPSGDEEADFADMLRKFKQGVAENVDPEDYQSHYDLAIAFKEMGLVDEAIAEFQKALGSPTNRLPTYEALGQCFLDKAQYKLASSILSRALHERAPEEQLVGVLYLLGRSAEAQNLPSEAVTYYQRVFVLDIQFRDTADRLSELERATR